MNGLMGAAFRVICAWVCMGSLGLPQAYAWSCRDIFHSKPFQKLFSFISGQPAPLRVKAFAFDFDDNIVILPTPIYIFRIGSDDVIPISTERFADIRGELGQGGTEWEHFELRRDPVSGSFKDFRDHYPEGNICLTHLKQAIRDNPDGSWKGPGWEAFEYAMRRPHTAKWTTLITARGHEPETLLEVFEFLKSEGFIAHTPKLKNIFPVTVPDFYTRFPEFKTHPLYDPDIISPSRRKLLVKMMLLDQIEDRPIKWWMPKVVSRTGKGFERLHTFGFSDDDPHTFKETLAYLRTESASGRWPHVKISLFFTGESAEIHSRRVVLMSDGEIRDRVSAEVYEFHRVVTSSLD
jgi:hypothetical protein